MAAGVTYTPIATTTVSGSTTNQITFSSISNSYTDLVIIINGLSTTSTGSSSYIRFNSDSSAVYSQTDLDGTGTSAVSDRQTGNTQFYIDYYAVWDNTNPSMRKVQINNYANTTTYKTGLSQSYRAGTAGAVDAIVCLWRSTSAITQIDYYAAPTEYFAAGSMVTLYGITAA